MKNNQKLMSFSKTLLKIISLVIGVPLICIVSIYFIAYLRLLNWRSFTSPLPNEIKIDLCQKFVDSYEDEKICDDENETYGPDFYPFIESILLPSKGDSLGKNSVEFLLDPYLIRCNTYPETSALSGVCDYDLRGDNIYRFVIFFDKEQKVDSVVMKIETP